MADGKGGDVKLKRPLLDGGPEEEAEKPVKTKTVSSSNGGESSSHSVEKPATDEETDDPDTKPAPAKMSKFGFAIGTQVAKKPPAISIKLGANKPKEPTPTLAPKTLSVAAIFNEDEDSEPEEMPPEAKMRMKNIGRDTPTSAGPNSFNKGKHGFSDNQKLWERNMKSHLGNVREHDD
ncbi:PEST proteolytic signal-containing nuclear protein [Lacerta agilis]|uniref:PEST proteolytic signal-containing nuclear protein n=1 Tax=Podarcis lilfordi TaxID=74358 RepID=A0AA35K8B8_9SAUR|nr:PEST proteolytic signal-containing nuclear protein [Lacerta agilis]CAI5772921.1 proteolytic signal-containing nuclear [Podarcis lilfordi]